MVVIVIIIVVLKVYLKRNFWCFLKFILISLIRMKVVGIKGDKGNLVVECFNKVVCFIFIGFILKLVVVWLIIGKMLK